MRDAGRELDVLQASRDLAQRIGPDLAVLARQERRDLLAMLVDQVPHPEQDLGPSADARRTPTWKGRLRGSNRRVDLLDRCEVDLSGRLARGGVIDGALAAARARHPGTVDPVIDPLQLGRVALPGDRRLCDVRHDAPRVRSVYLVRPQPYSARPNPSERWPTLARRMPNAAAPRA